MRAVKKPPTGVSWGELRPSQTCEWEEGKNGVSLLMPRFGTGGLGQLVARLFQPRPLKVHLDDVGTFVWRRCDGSTSVAEIADSLREQFGERIEPAEERLVTFIAKLHQSRFITLDH